MAEDQLASILSGDFEKEVRKRDNQIRSLATEIDNLNKQKEVLSSEIQEINDKLASSRETLGNIDIVIKSKRDDFEAQRIKSFKELSDRETALKSNWDVQDAREKQIKEKESSIKIREDNLQSMKIQSVEHIKSLLSSLNLEVSEFSVLFGEI